MGLDIGNIVKGEMLYEGKAKKVFATNNPEYVIIDYKDDATAFNGEKKGTIDDKGILNNSISSLLFELLRKNGVKSHYVAKISDREVLCKKVSIIPLEVIVRNVAAGSYGDAAVAAMSIVGRIFHFLLSALIGFGQGFQPVAGYNYGARRFDRVAEAYGFTVKTGTVFLTVVGVVGWWLAPEVIRLFQSDDPQVVVIGTIAFRAQCLALPLQPTVVLANMLFQSTGRAFRALFISATRQGIYFLPLILILPRFYGLGGVEYTQPLSDLMAFLSSIPFLWSFFRELRGAGTVAEGSAVGGAVPQPAGSR